MYDNLLLLPLFQGLSKNDLTTIIEKGKLNFLQYKEGEIFIHQGEIIPHLYTGGYDDLLRGIALLTGDLHRRHTEKQGQGGNDAAADHQNGQHFIEEGKPSSSMMPRGISASGVSDQGRLCSFPL